MYAGSVPREGAALPDGWTAPVGQVTWRTASDGDLIGVTEAWRAQDVHPARLRAVLDAALAFAPVPAAVDVEAMAVPGSRTALKVNRAWEQLREERRAFRQQYDDLVWRTAVAPVDEARRAADLRARDAQRRNDADAQLRARIDWIAHTALMPSHTKALTGASGDRLLRVPPGSSATVRPRA